MQNIPVGMIYARVVCDVRKHRVSSDAVRSYIRWYDAEKPIMMTSPPKAIVPFTAPPPAALRRAYACRYWLKYIFAALYLRNYSGTLLVFTGSVAGDTNAAAAYSLRIINVKRCCGGRRWYLSIVDWLLIVAIGGVWKYRKLLNSVTLVIWRITVMYCAAMPVILPVWNQA